MARHKIISNDQWLSKNFEKIIDKFAGGYIVIGDGKVLFTNKDGSPREIVNMAKAQYPNLIPLFLRVPYPHEFLCALSAL